MMQRRRPSKISSTNLKRINKKVFLCLLCIFLLSSCALIPKRTKISWPNKINYLEAFCEMDLSWMDMKYSGSVSLIMDYPERLSIEAYSTFGDTVFFLNRYGDYFLLLFGDEKITKESEFEERFNINIKDFMEDLSLKNISEKNREVEIKRERYTMVYNLEDENRICLIGNEGRICIKFLEVRFTKEGT